MTDCWLFGAGNPFFTIKTAITFGAMAVLGF
jgi:hypothetical protein